MTTKKATMMAASKLEEFKRRELMECHKAFERHVRESFEAIDCFTEYTLSRDEHGHYTNMSVSMEWTIWRRAWREGRAFQMDEEYYARQNKKKNRS